MSYLDSEVRPWGSYHIICNDKKFKIKKLKLILVKDYPINIIIKDLRHGQLFQV